MTNLLIDNVNPTKTVGWTNNFDKITFNLNIIKTYVGKCKSALVK